MRVGWLVINKSLILKQDLNSENLTLSMPLVPPFGTTLPIFHTRGTRMLGWFSTRCCKTNDARKVSRRCSRSTELQMRANIKAFMDVFFCWNNLDWWSHRFSKGDVRKCNLHFSRCIFCLAAKGVRMIDVDGWKLIVIFAFNGWSRWGGWDVFWIQYICFFHFGWMLKSFVNHNDYPRPPAT